MALPSSSLSSSWKYDVFLSFHVPDVRVTFLSHLHKQFERKRIITFNGEGVERSQTNNLEITQAIQESRIVIVVLSENYASSSWCLNELVEILQYKKPNGKIVMAIFYKVHPSDVRKQNGNFGQAFKKTCQGKTEAEIESWTNALNYVSNIVGEHSLNWVNEAEMIEMIAIDVLNKLNVKPSREFDVMVGLDIHLGNMKYLLNLGNDEPMIVGISGPSGIGKTTIARALYNQLACDFSLTYFMENVKGSSRSIDCDEYGSKLRLQEHFLSKILNQTGMKICHLDVRYKRLWNQKVLIILDDVDHLEQLDALARDISWFGPGSRIIVISEAQKVLHQHGINYIYHVRFPSNEEALEIFCRYAFRESSPTNGFEKLSRRITEVCGNLTLCLSVVGSSLRGKKKDEWEDVVRRLKTNVDDGDIQRALRVGYESLLDKDQILFLHIAVFFNNQDDDHVNALLGGSNLDVRLGLRNLVNRSLIGLSTNGVITMHKLLQQTGRQAIQRQELSTRYILINPHDICHVLESDDDDAKAVVGISFDTSEISKVVVCKRAFKRMRNLRFLSVYRRRNDVKESVHDFPPRLRLLHWESYRRKYLPLRFCPEYLVEIDMQYSKLEKLWEGTQLLASLKTINLSWSTRLKEFPDLSNATNLSRLDLNYCESLVEIPSSIENLHSLKELWMQSCIKLETVPTRINLASLERVNMAGCSRLRTFPDISTNMRQLFLSDTAIEEVPESISQWSHLWYVDLRGSINLKSLTHLPESVVWLNISYTDIKEIPDCIKGLHGLKHLILSGCKKLESLPELPGSLTFLMADDCESLKTVGNFALNTPNAQLNFTNCFKLSEEASRLIIQRSFLKGFACLPGTVMPCEFHHKARGNSLTIRAFAASSRFEACVMISPDQHQHTREHRYIDLQCRIVAKRGWSIYKHPVYIAHPSESQGIQTEHLCIFHLELPEEEICLEFGSDILFEFSSRFESCVVTECGIRDRV